MGRSILAIAKEAAERDNTAPAPTSLFAQNTKVAKVLRVAAMDTLREYLRRSGHTGLSEFQSTWVFSLQPGRYAYPLPPDFLRMIPNTEHRGGWPLGLVGPASPQTWASWIFGGAVTAVEMGWRVRNNAIFFEPTPSAAEIVAIEYISRYPVVSRIREGDFDFSVSPPMANAPFVPRDGHLDLAGLDLTEPVDNQGIYDGPPGWDIGLFGGEVSEVLRQINPLSNRAPFPQVRRPAFEADEDEPAFEDDYLLSLGMTFRLRRGLGLDYAEAAAEYELEMDQRLAHDAGGARAIRLGGDSPDWDTYPVGGGKWLVT
jgi:hypothetical protein